MLYNNNGYGRGVRRTFVAEFARLGGTLVSIDPYLGEQPDVTPYMERLARQGADFIVVAGYRSEAEQALRESEERFRLATAARRDAQRCQTRSPARVVAA